MGQMPGPTTNVWCSIGDWAGEEPPSEASDMLPTAVLDEDVLSAGIGEANVETNEGTIDATKAWEGWSEDWAWDFEGTTGVWVDDQGTVASFEHGWVVSGTRLGYCELIWRSLSYEQ